MKSSKQRLKRVRPLLGTYVEIALEGSAPFPQLNTWMSRTFERLAELDQRLSIHCPTSDISRLNQLPPQTWVAVHPDTIQVLRAANTLWKESKGFFDIRCVEPAMRTRKEPRCPTDIRKHWVRRQGAGLLDLGGIGKGFAVDCGVEELQRLSRGHRLDGLINAGGDLRRFGKRLPPIALATSAVRTARNRHLLSPAWHIDPLRGRVVSKAPSVSVMAEKCLWADALTKVAMLAPSAITRRCLQSHHANAMTFSSRGEWKEIA